MEHTASTVEVKPAELKVSVKATASIATRNYLSGQLLWTARHNAELCRDREALVAGRRAIDVQHRSYAATAVLLSVAFLEAAVNEVFEDAMDQRHLSERVARLAPEARMRLSSFWVSVDSGRYSLLGKYQMALLLCGAEEFEKGSQPLQDVQLLVKFRNGLVHFRPAWHETGFEGTKKRDFDVLGERFKQSGLLSDEDGSDWLTVKALGASGAEWAVRTSRTFAGEWMRRLGIASLFESDLANMDREIREP